MFKYILNYKNTKKNGHKQFFYKEACRDKPLEEIELTNLTILQSYS